MPTLYITGHDTEARLENGRIEVTRLDPTKDDAVSMRVPLFDIDHVVITGKPVVTMPVLHALAHEGIPVYFLTRTGRWLAGFYPTVNGHALRRIKQYELARQPEFALTIARALVAAKIRNCRRVLQRLAANRDLAHNPGQVDVCNSLLATMNRATQAEDLDTLRGHEGLAAAIYFRHLSQFFPGDILFQGRNRRPPRDPANALLSWTYTIALAEIDGAVRAAGLDPTLGFLHEISYGRPSLSLDLLEPLRPSLCDLLVLHILNHHILATDDFETRDDDGTYLRRDSHRAFFHAYETAMTRRFAASKNAPHTDFRAVIRDSVNSVLRAMENRAAPEFFHMP